MAKIEKPRMPHLSLSVRLGIGQLTIIAAGVLGAEALTWLLLPWLVTWVPLHTAAVAAVAAVLGGTAAYLAGRQAQRRLADLVMVAEAWLRGNLTLRINDPTDDAIGALARRLDALVEHLEEDEQDLDRLRESNARLTDQVRALAVVEERNRLARELHDTVKQHLFSLAMTASAARTQFEMQQPSQADAPEPGSGGERGSVADVLEVYEALEPMVREMETEARAAQRETTRLIEDLRPASLHQRGFAEALNDYTLLFGAQEHILVYLDVQCEDQSLPPSVTEALYRVAQETLHNVARHARATRVDIRVRCTRRRIMMTIEDNGVGFEMGRARQGLGITNMQERIMAVDGRLTVESEPGVGTTVHAEVEVGPDIRSLSSDAERAARPRTEAWGWLGQKLMIPVGQMWPWSSPDQARYLRRPTVEPGRFVLKRERHFLGLLHRYGLWAAERPQHHPIVRIYPERAGARWEIDGRDWTLRHVRGLKGRAILERGELPLAAMQYRGRELDTWTDIIYDDTFYRLAHVEDGKGGFVLSDEDDELFLTIEGARMRLHQTLPLPLVVMVAARFIEESAIRRIADPNGKRNVETPTPPRPSPADEALRFKLRKELRAVVRGCADDLPADVLARVEAVERSILAILPHIENLNSSHPDAYTVRQTIRDYLPHALEEYRALPVDFAEGRPIQEGKTAHQHLLVQVSLIQQGIDDIAERLPQDTAQRLLSHGRFLKKKFAKPARALEQGETAASDTGGKPLS
jgi:signal transduction histidine kinase